MEKSSQDQITWFQVNNIVPLVTSAVMIALSWGALNSKVDLISQKLDTYIANQNKIIDDLADHQKINDQSISQLKIDLNSLLVIHKGQY